MLYPVSSILIGKDDPQCVQTNETVRDALVKMIVSDYSQMPVVDDNGNMEGIISEQTVTRTSYHLDEKVPLLELTVEHCMEPAVTLSQDDELFEALDRLRDTYAIIIVDDRRPIGIITHYDATQFFRNVAEGLLMVENIEVTLREYIDNVLEDEETRVEAMDNAFSNWEAQTGRPKEYDRLSLGDYIQLIVNGDNWSRFENYFEPKNLFLQYMHSVRKIRNQLAHFRDELDEVQYDSLRRVVDWIESRPKPALRAAESGGIRYVESTEEPISEDDPGAVTGRYAPFYRWLAQRAGSTGYGYDVSVTFDEIETLLDGDLPPSAREYRAWWANDPTSGRQSHAWMRAGWKVESVDFSAATVTFRRSDTVRYHLFYADLLRKLKEERPGITRATKTHPSNEWYFGGGRAGINFGWVFSSDSKLRTQLYIDTGDKSENKNLYDELFAEKEQIEREFGGTLHWERLDDYQASRISASMPATIAMSWDKLEEAKAWALETMFRLVDALKSRVKRL